MRTQRLFVTSVIGHASAFKFSTAVVRFVKVQLLVQSSWYPCNAMGPNSLDPAGIVSLCTEQSAILKVLGFFFFDFCSIVKINY